MIITPASFAILCSSQLSEATAIAALPGILDLWSSRRSVFLETGSSRWIFSSALTFSSVVLLFSDTFLSNKRQYFPISFDLRPLFLSADDVFSWFVYDVITFVTASLYTHTTNWPILLQMPQQNAHQKFVLHWKSNKSPILQFFHTKCYWTQTVMRWYWYCTA